MVIKNIDKIVFENTVSGMMPEQEGYTTPWALVISSSGGAYLDTQQPVSERKDRLGSMVMYIRRNTYKVGDYDIDVADVDVLDAEGEAVGYIWRIFSDQAYLDNICRKFPKDLVSMGKVDMSKILKVENAKYVADENKLRFSKKNHSVKNAKNRFGNDDKKFGGEKPEAD